MIPGAAPTAGPSAVAFSPEEERTVKTCAALAALAATALMAAVLALGPLALPDPSGERFYAAVRVAYDDRNRAEAESHADLLAGRVCLPVHERRMREVSRRLWEEIGRLRAERRAAR